MPGLKKGGSCQVKEPEVLLQPEMVYIALLEENSGI
jgi:hypothetical protein